MVLPATVTGSWSDFLNAQHGPFEVGGNLYVATVDKTNNKVLMMKSTDGGSTWAEVDAANHPASVTAAAYKTISAQALSTSIYVAYLESALGKTTVNSFDTTTDLWGTATAASAALPNFNDTSQAPLVLAVRAAGSYVIAYNGPTSSAMGTAYRCVYLQRYASGAWQTAQVVSDASGSSVHSDLRAMVGPDSSGRCHVFYGLGATTTLYWKTLLAANTLSVQASVASVRNAAVYDVGNGAVNGSEILLFSKPVSSPPAGYILRGTTGDTLALTATGVSDATVEGTTANSGALAVSGGTVYAFYIQQTNDDLYRDSDGGTNTWGVDVAQEAAITCLGVNANAITSAIGILFNDNGTVKYDAYSLSTAVVSSKASDWNVRAAIASTKAAAWNVIGTIVSTKAADWNVVTTVAATTKASDWHVRTVVAQSRASDWNLAGRVVQSVAADWNIRAAVAQTKAADWNVVSTVGQSASSDWHVRAAVAKSTVSEWNVQGRVVQSVSADWHVRGVVAKAVPAEWNVRTTAGQSKASDWNVRTSVSQSKAADWHVMAAVAKSAASEWNVRAAVAQTKAAAWHVATSVGKSMVSEWNAIGRIVKAVVAEWNVAGSITAVVKSIASDWHVRAAVAQTKAADWHVLTSVAQSKMSDWNVRAAIAQAKAADWHVRAVVSDTQAAEWHVRVPATQTKAAAWNVNASVSQTKASDWNVASPVQQTKASDWYVRTSVTASKPSEWNVAGAVSKAAPSEWHVRSVVSDSQAADWHVRSAVADTAVSDWHVRAAVTRTRVSEWNVASTLLPVVQSAVSDWHVRALAQQTASSSWHVLSLAPPAPPVVTPTKGGGWSRIFDLSRPQWRPPREKTPEVKLRRVTATARTAWRTEAIIRRYRLSDWNVRASVTVAANAEWHVLWLDPAAWANDDALLGIDNGSDEAAAMIALGV